MRISHRLRPLAARFSRIPTPRTRQRPTFRPRLEALEDRLCPSGGLLDPTFGSGGIVTQAFTSSPDSATAVVVQPDGKIVTADRSAGGSVSTGFLSRYNSDGSLDTTFGSGGRTVPNFTGTWGSAGAVALQPGTNGKLLAAGSGMVKGNKTEFALARYNPDGSLDTTFGSNGRVMTAIGSSAYNYATGMVVQPDGKIILVGTGGTSGYNSICLVRYTANGALDTTFGKRGQVITTLDVEFDGGSQVSVALQGDGKVVVVGTSSVHGSVGQRDDFVVARFTANGAADPTFGGGKGWVATFGGNGIGGAALEGSVAIQTDGRIVVAGTAFTDLSLSTPLGVALARYNPDGSLDSTFAGGRGVEAVGPADLSGSAVAIQSDGGIVVGGSRSVQVRNSDGTVSNSGAMMAERFNPDGTLDTSYGPTGTGATGGLVGSYSEAGAMALEADGTVVLVGAAQLGTGTPLLQEQALARFLPPNPTTSAVQIGSFTAAATTVSAGGTNTLTAGAITDTNAGATILAVAFYAMDVGGTEQFLGYATQNPDGSWSLTITVNLAPGEYSLLALALDSTGSISDPLTINLDVQ
jgi:uncharacterized delta-60 repeat protein